MPGISSFCNMSIDPVAQERSLGMDTIPKVIQAVAGPDYTVYAYFHDGTVRLFDASPLLEKGGVFLPLRDAEYFRTQLTVLNDAVAWDIDGTKDSGTCIDLDPCEIYKTCPVVDDPLREVSRPHEKPLDISALSRGQLHAELEKGYTDIAAGRTKPAREVFVSIHKDYGF